VLHSARAACKINKEIFMQFKIAHWNYASLKLASAVAVALAPADVSPLILPPTSSNFIDKVSLHTAAASSKHAAPEMTAHHRLHLHCSMLYLFTHQNKIKCVQSGQNHFMWLIPTVRKNIRD